MLQWIHIILQLFGRLLGDLTVHAVDSCLQFQTVQRDIGFVFAYLSAAHHSSCFKGEDYDKCLNARLFSDLKDTDCKTATSHGEV